MTQTVESLREYETIYVLNPEVSDSVAKDFMLKMKELVSQEGGKNIKVDCWGRRRLAWERNKQLKGLYVHHLYLGKPEIIKEYERTLSIDEKVLLRQSIVLKDAVDPASRAEEADQLEAPVIRERREFSDRREYSDRRGYDDYNQDRSDRQDRPDRQERYDRPEASRVVKDAEAPAEKSEE